MRTPESLLELTGLALGAALLSYGSCWLVYFALSRWRMLDVPNARSSHTRPTPRGGGTGIVTIFIGAALLSAGKLDSSEAWLVAVTVGGLALVSFWDDRLKLSWRVRLGGHLVAAAAGAVWLRPEPAWLGWGLFPVIVLLLAGHANAFNFMDGINGLAGGQAVVASLSLAVLASGRGAEGIHPAGVLAVVLAGSAAGFLPHNFPRARMFMGDVGSVPLGFALMLLSVWLARDRGLSAWVPLLAIQSGFILDAGLTLARRWWRGESVQEAHREHFYQRLVRSGWTHPAATGSFLAVSSGVSAAALALAWSDRAPGWTIVVSVTAWGVYFGICEAIFRAKHRN